MMNKIFKGSLTLMSFSYLLACSVIDTNSVKAKAGAPEAAQVHDVAIAYDDSKPKFVLIIEPVRVFQEENITTLNSNVEANIGNKDAGFKIPLQGHYSQEKRALTYSLLSRQLQITQQLTSALSGVKNFQPVDYNFFISNKSKFKTLENEKGPYVIKAQITEWNEHTEESETKIQVPGLYRDKNQVQKSMVGLDISVQDPNSGRVITSFPVRGTYTKANVENKASLIIQPIYTKTTSQQSAVDQALRLALNEAAEKLFVSLEE